ncbi:LacI family DNA-binding transcriptional regulator [Meridianimarinicoccus sp. RP-17]|uniref:LacI family DNA-binding transcriptional regulator n=1 Tax=Meridianimarinicoccus zhengii TaxID=2056810 RepID=UPI000DABD91B|nr:LacI family DNA-binding transcriptional regulator [Phycocomes zhengii]
MGRPTVHDIARTAGVSLATVDRVLNARPGVRAQTVARVEAAIRDIGYVRDIGAANLARRRLYRFLFLLPDGDSRFVDGIAADLDEARRIFVGDRVQIAVQRVPVRDPHALAAALAALDPGDLAGLAVMAPQSPELRDAAARLRRAGLPVVALVSDQPAEVRDHFVGIDNDAAGRTAARLMGRFLGHDTGPVLLVTSSIRARDSLERRFGFDSLRAADFPALEVLPTLEAHDDPARMVRIIDTAFAARPDIAGVYSLSSGNGALLGALARHPGRRVVIAHELTPLTRGALLDGRLDAVITQDTGHLVRSAIRVLQARCDGRDIVASQERIRIEIILRENLP